jgi:hypothetical protein
MIIAGGTFVREIDRPRRLLGETIAAAGGWERVIPIKFQQICLDKEASPE